MLNIPMQKYEEIIVLIMNVKASNKQWYIILIYIFKGDGPVGKDACYTNLVYYMKENGPQREW